MDKDRFYMRIAHFQGDMSDRRLSILLGKNENYIHNMKQQRIWPSLDIFFKMCRVLKISPATFFEIDSPNTSIEEEAFYANLKKKIKKDDYPALSKTAAKANEDDFHNIAIFLSKYIKD